MGLLSGAECPAANLCVHTNQRGPAGYSPADIRGLLRCDNAAGQLIGQAALKGNSLIEWNGQDTISHQSSEFSESAPECMLESQNQ